MFDAVSPLPTTQTDLAGAVQRRDVEHRLVRPPIGAETHQAVAEHAHRIVRVRDGRILTDEVNER